MQVEVNKNELAGALSALGKLICRTSPVEAFRSMQIAGKENKLHFRTTGPEENIEFQMAAETKDFSVVVEFEAFRQAVRGSRNKALVLEYADGNLAMDGVRLVTVDCEFPEKVVPADGAKSEILPDNFVELLNTAAPIVNRNDYRKVLQGINLSRDGITATNGKELFNAPLPLEVANLTIPFPLALIATKTAGPSSLCYWTDGTGVFFRITAGDWMWSGKALAGTYPNWRLVVPKQEDLTRTITFTPERAEQLKNWLKSVPDDPPNNGIELRRNNDALILSNLKGLEVGVTAYFTGEWEDYKLVVNRDLLLRMLNHGHTKMECPDGHGPFLATGGIGQYIAMPLFLPKTEHKSETKQEPKTEESNMNENATVVPAPMQVVAIAPETEPVNPLEDLTVTIEAFKLKLKGIFEESNALSRKVKEVAIAQKQKERDFILAKRAIERIRMAI